jgi:hypothetical protein
MTFKNYPELELDEIVPKLTWHPFDMSEFGAAKRDDYHNSFLPLGTICRDSAGAHWLVGDVSGNGYTEGCGCCSDDIEIVEIAFLAELLKGD